MNYRANPSRYARMTYRRCGHGGPQLPAIALGLWHNFGDAAPRATQREVLRTAFDAGITLWQRSSTEPSQGAA